MHQLSPRFDMSSIKNCGQLKAQFDEQHAPEEVAVLNERYDRKSLKSLIFPARIFGLYEEPTEKVGIRVLYKMK